MSRSDYQDLRRVGSRIYVHDHLGMLDGLENLVGRNTIKPRR